MADMKTMLTDVIASNELAGLQAGLEIDRVRAAAMGVTPLAVDNTLYDAFGQRQIKTIYLPSNYSRVVLEAGPARQADPTTLNSIFVPGTSGGQVPLAALTRLGRSHGAMWMAHSGQFPAVTISFDTVPGVSIGQAIAAIRQLERAIHLPDDIHAEFRGEAGEASKTGAQQEFLFAAAVFAVYIVLGVLYESYRTPANHTDDFAAGYVRRIARAAYRQYRIHPDYHNRVHLADRYGDEECNYAGGLRLAGGTPGWSCPCRCHLAGGAPPCASDHHDHPGGSHECRSARHRHGTGI